MDSQAETDAPLIVDAPPEAPLAPEAEAEVEAEDELIVTIGEEAPPQKDEPAPQWVRDLRKQNREQQRRIKELEAKGNDAQRDAAPVVTKKPTLEDVDYDEGRFELALEGWQESKRKVADAKAKAKAEQDRVGQEWQGRLAHYADKRAALKAGDFDEAEAIVIESFSVVQQGVLLQGADDPALITLALGRHPAKAKELASIKDPVKFAFAVAKLETQLKTSARKAAPEPERKIRGSGSTTVNISDAHLTRLEALADKSGDRTAVIAYKKAQRDKSKKD